MVEIPPPRPGGGGIGPITLPLLTVQAKRSSRRNGGVGPTAMPCARSAGTSLLCRCRPNSCARRMAPRSRIASQTRRWLSRVGRDYAIYLGDDLYGHQPKCADVLAAGGSFIFGCKPSSHKTLTEYLVGIDLDGFSETIGVGSAKRVHRYRWMEDVPLRDGKDALTVNWVTAQVAAGKKGVDAESGA